VSVFPNAPDKLYDDDVVPSRRFNFPPFVNWGLTVGLMYYP
jgi:hypothetical protein